MDYFEYRQGVLHCEDVPAAELARTYGTPLYVYSLRTVREHYDKIAAAFADVPHRICYAVKANSNLSLLRALASWGAGFDVVSGGELARVQAAGGDPSMVMFAGVGKTDAEIERALAAGIFLFNVESEEELVTIDRLARAAGTVAPVTLRLNPDVDPKTHTYIATGKKAAKFGIDLERAERLIGSLAGLPGIALKGLHCHIGSQITETGPYREAAQRVTEYLARVRDAGHPIEWLNLGGGFGIHYKGGEGLPAEAYAEVMIPYVQKAGCTLALEPGRFIVGNAGVLLTRVIYTKARTGDSRFVICDAAMNDLLRPSLYQAYHRVWPAEGAPGDVDETTLIESDLVGPICESGDFLAKERKLPALARGDLVSVFSAGAYGFVMASNYNTRPRAAEVLVDGATHRVIRRRETLDDLLAPELEALPDGP